MQHRTALTALGAGPAAGALFLTTMRPGVGFADARQVPAVAEFSKYVLVAAWSGRREWKTRISGA